MAKTYKKIKNKYKKQAKRKLKKWVATITIMMVALVLGYFQLPLLDRFKLDADEYMVVSVSDGDTVKVLAPDGKEIKVRLAYIDAPEKSQNFGKESTRYLTALIYHKAIKLERVDTDQYGRTVARILLNDQDVNLTMVKNGWAWHYQIKGKKQFDSAIFSGSQLSAQRKKLGLWKTKNPIAPWRYRAEQRYNRSNKIN